MRLELTVVSKPELQVQIGQTEQSSHDTLFSQSREKQRLHQQINRLQDDWELVNHALAKLTKASILETRVEEKLRLEPLIAAKEDERNQIGQKLQGLEKQLSAIESRTKS